MSGIYIPNVQFPPKPWSNRLIVVLDGDKRTAQFTLAENLEKVEVPFAIVPDHKRRVVYRGDVYNAIEAKRLKTLEHALNDPYINGMHDGLKQALFALATVDDVQPISFTNKEDRE